MKSFAPDNVVLIKLNNFIKLISLQDLFNILKSETPVVNIDNDENINFINLEEKNIYILDKGKFTKLLGITKRKNNKKILKVKIDTGEYICVTNDHPCIIGENYEKNIKYADELIVNYDKQFIFDIREILKYETSFFNINSIDIIELNDNEILIDYDKSTDEILIFKNLLNNAYNNIYKKILLNKKTGYLVGTILIKKLKTNNMIKDSILYIEDDDINKLINIKDILFKECFVSSEIYYEKNEQTYVLYTPNSLIMKFINNFIDFENKCLSDNILVYNKDFISGIIFAILCNYVDSFYTVYFDDIEQIIKNNELLKGQISYILKFLNFKRINSYWCIIKDIIKYENYCEHVYDLTTETETFVLHNILVKN